MELLRAARAVLIGGAVLGLVVGVAGCNGSSPDVTPTPTATPAPVTSPSVVAPSVSAAPSVSPSAFPAVSPAGLSDEELLQILPAGAEREDLQGAVVTAEFFIQEFPRMFSSGDTEVWDALSLPGCDFCADSRAKAVASEKSGEVTRGGKITQGSSITEARLRDDDRVEVMYPIKVAAIYRTPSGGDEELVVDEKSGIFYVLTERVGNVWHVAGVQNSAD